MKSKDYNDNLIRLMLRAPGEAERLGLICTEPTEMNIDEIRICRRALVDDHGLRCIPPDTFSARKHNSIGREVYEHAANIYKYHPETGYISSRRKSNLGSVNDTGYRVIGFSYQGRTQGMQAHRLAFFIAHGELPEVVDHVNGNRSDNRICNLRAATHRENMANRVDSADDLNIRKGARCWSARIGKFGRVFNLGYFRYKRDAVKARDDAETMTEYELDSLQAAMLGKPNKTGHRGIIATSNGTFQVQKSVPKSLRHAYGRKIHIGTFGSIEEAIKKRDHAYELYNQGINPRTGEPLAIPQ